MAVTGDSTRTSTAVANAFDRVRTLTQPRRNIAGMLASPVVGRIAQRLGGDAVPAGVDGFRQSVYVARSEAVDTSPVRQYLHGLDLALSDVTRDGDGGDAQTSSGFRGANRFGVHASRW